MKQALLAIVVGWKTGYAFGRETVQEAAMALVSSGHVTTVQRWLEQLEASRTPEAQAAYLAELRASVKRYEARYGMASERIHDAIDAGLLVEDLDVCNWIFDYELLRDIEER